MHDITKLDRLFSALILYRHNVHVLHWKVKGKDFDPVHALLDLYLSSFNGFIDEVGEIMLMCSENPICLKGVMHVVEEDPDHQYIIVDANNDFDSEDCFEIIGKMFVDLLHIYEDSCDACPDDIVSKLQEHMLWLRKEAVYKNKRRLD